MKDGNGPVIDRPKVVLVFRGPGWVIPSPGVAGEIDEAAVAQAFRAMLRSPYASELVQYRGIRRPTLVEMHTDTNPIGHLGPDPRGFLTTQVRLIDTSEIIDAVKSARKLGTMEPIGDAALYLVSVFTDPLPVFSQANLNNAMGFHDHFSDDAGKDVRYGCALAWTGNPAASLWNSSGGIPAVLSHEMVEACSDPDTSSGFHLDNGEEIGDINDVRGVQLPGITQTLGLAAYWSDLRGSGVVPNGYSLRITLGLRPTDKLPSLLAAVGHGSLQAAMRARLEP
jgi:hypothetical protein